MNKRDALRACLDGKRVTHPDVGVVFFGPAHDVPREAFRFANGEFVAFTANMPDDDRYELYVEPPKEVTRAEAWAALGDGKTVRVVEDGGRVRWLFCCDKAGFRFCLEGATQPEWRQVLGAWAYVGLDTKYYIVEGA